MGECNGKPLLQVADCLLFLDEHRVLVIEVQVLCYGSTESCLEKLGHMGEVILL